MRRNHASGDGDDECEYCQQRCHGCICVRARFAGNLESKVVGDFRSTTVQGLRIAQSEVVRYMYPTWFAATLSI